MKKKKPLNVTVSDEARRLLALHAGLNGCSVSSLIERLIREENERWEKDNRWEENLRRIADHARMIAPK